MTQAPRVSFAMCLFLADHVAEQLANRGAAVRTPWVGTIDKLPREVAGVEICFIRQTVSLQMIWVINLRFHIDAGDRREHLSEAGFFAAECEAAFGEMVGELVAAFHGVTIVQRLVRTHCKRLRITT